MTGYTNLALRNVSRLQAGQYTCTASNVEGDGKSKELHLQIVCELIFLIILLYCTLLFLFWTDMYFYVNPFLYPLTYFL